MKREVNSMQNRLKSKVLWASVLALFYFIVKNWIGFEIPMWSEFVDLLLAVLVGFGIVNNPTDKNNF